jgi:hypothetical protein
MFLRATIALALLALATCLVPGLPAQAPGPRTYLHRLRPLTAAPPLLADYPQYVEPIREKVRFEAPALVEDDAADLDVRAWRFSYNARGIIEVPNHLRAAQTALIVVHPWGIDDGQGWQTPQPAGVAFAGYPQKNAIALAHMKAVVNPLLQALRGKVAIVGYSLPGREDPLRKKLYRSVRGTPTDQARAQAARELAARLAGFSYQGQPLPERMTLSRDRPVVDYFRQLGGTDASPRFNGTGFWELPIPVARPLAVDGRDVVFYDAEGYETLRAFLHQQQVRHVLLCGYHTDMCVCATTAGYQNLRNDFNVFLIGDATQATFPALDNPRLATTAALALASRDLFITQVSWVRLRAQADRRPGGSAP